MKTPELSKRAVAMLNRMYDGNFYRHDGADAPEGSAMRELIDAGLVVSGGRVNQIIRCYLPRGVKPLKVEAYPKRPKWLVKYNDAKRRQAALPVYNSAPPS